MLACVTVCMPTADGQTSCCMDTHDSSPEYGLVLPTKPEPQAPFIDSLAMLLPTPPSGGGPAQAPPVSEQFQLSSDALAQVSKLLKDAGYDALP